MANNSSALLWCGARVLTGTLENGVLTINMD
jgi:hypothetical protein